MQVANVFLCRSASEPFWRLPQRASAFIAAGMAVEVAAILAIDYTPAGNTLFGTAPLPAIVWVFALASAAAMLVLEEGRKAVARRQRLRRSA